MTVVVLARGVGRRMQGADARARLDARQQAAAASGWKGMMPMAGGRPFLDYALSALADAGCGDVVLVVPPDHQAVRDHYAPARLSRLTVRFAVQADPTGTAHAVLAAAPLVGERPFLVVNSDNLYPVDAVRALVDAAGPGLVAFERDALARDGGLSAERVAAFAVVRVDGDGWLAGIDEKPNPADLAAEGPTALISMNLWRFDARLFAACRDVARSPRGEYELPAAVMLAVRRGVRMRVLRSAGAVLDLSHRGDVARVSAALADVEPRL